MTLLDFHALASGAGEIISILFQNMIMSSILFLIVYGITKIFRKITPAWQMGLWTMVIIRMVLPPDIHLAYSAVDLITRWLPLSQSNMIISPIIPGFLPDLSTWSNPMQNSLNPVGLTSFIELGLCTIWGLGALIFFGLYLRKWMGIRRIVQSSNPLKHTQIDKIIDEWRSRFNIKRTVRVVTSDTSISPFTQGLLSPIIYIPQTMLGMQDRQILESIIAHEMAHIQQFDDLWVKLQIVGQILFFFHPVVWLVNGRIHLVRECLCDSMVLSKKKISAEIYGSDLLTVLKRNMGNDTLRLVPGFGNARQKWRFRIHYLKGEHSMKKYEKWLTIIGLIALALFIMPMSMGTAGNRENANAAPSPWLDNIIPESSIFRASQPVTMTFQRPLAGGIVTARYGKFRHPFKKVVEHHNGIDVKAPKGTPVVAAADGTVIFAGHGKDRGHYIVIQHAESYTTNYSHLNEVLVSEDQIVRAGDLIGRVGTTGLSTGDHLHFELRKDDNPVNPEDLIDF